jgi:cell division protein FtsN
MAGNRPARERFEFSLDARQVAAVILGSLGALAVAFFLGHALGQRVAERPAAPAAAGSPAAAPAPADPLAALDQAPRPDGGDSKTPLTFHDALTSARPPADKLPAVPKASAPAPAAEAARAVALPPPATPAPGGPTGSTGSTGPVQASAAAPSAPSTPIPAAATAPAPAPATQKAPPPPKVASAPAPKGTAAAPRGAAPKGAFSVQVGSTQDRFEAERIAARFASRGPKVSVAEVPGKGRWYRVRLGSFESREAADRYLKELERSTGAKGFVAAN